MPGRLYLNGWLARYRTAVLLPPEHGYATVAFGNHSQPQPQPQPLPQIAKRLSELQQELTGDDLAMAIDAFAE